jgi:molecular chaperone DnaK
MTSGSRLGVDFGTTHTVAVVRWEDGRARALLFEGSPLLPSAVFAEPTEPGSADRVSELTVGRDALHSARSEPANLEPNPKRRIDEQELLLGERVVPLGDAIAAVLRHVVSEHHRTVGGPPDKVTLTCPANWGATRRFVLADAARAAGMPEVRLVAEPVAAATYFVLGLGHHVPVGAAAVVYDFGAGTFDASVVANTGAGFSVLAVDGLDTVGGLDLDEVTLQLVGEHCPPDGWQRLTHPSSPAERRAAYELREQVRTAKERLSRSASVTVHVPLLDLDVIVTRAELQEKAKPLVDQTIRVTSSVIRFARLTPQEVAGVFLVGGASRMPLVATLLHRTFGRAPIVLEQPELVVAEGSVLVPDGNIMPGGGESESVTTPAARSAGPSGLPPPAPPGPSGLPPPAPVTAPVSPAPTAATPPMPDQAPSQQPQPQLTRSTRPSSPRPSVRPRPSTFVVSTSPRQRPTPIRSTVVVLWIGAVYAMLIAVIEAITADGSSSGKPGVEEVLAVLMSGTLAVASVAAAIGVSRAKRWARNIVYLLCGLTAVAFVLVPVIEVKGLSLALVLAATVLVSVPSSRSWFKQA